MRLGLYGGTYDPIHVGHLIIAEYVREELDLTEVLFIPSGEPPHKECSTPPEQRAALVRAAIEGNPRFLLSDIELRRPGPSYSVTTIEKIREEHRLERDDVFWMIGADSLVEMHTWHQPERILDLATTVVLPRIGVDLEDAHASLRERSMVISGAPLLDISSTDVRARVRQGKSIRYLVPQAVEKLIRSNRLYL